MRGESEHPNIISSIVLYRHEILFLTMRKEHNEGMLKAGCIREYPEMEEVTGSCKDYILRYENLDPH